MDVVCLARCVWLIFFFFKKKTAYDLRISDWSSDVCSSDLPIEHDVARIDRVAGGEQQGALDHVFKLADIAGPVVRRELVDRRGVGPGHRLARAGVAQDQRRGERGDRSEEHTSELQSLMRPSYAVFCLNKKQIHTIHQ